MVQRSYARNVGRGSVDTGSTVFGYDMKFDGNTVTIYDTAEKDNSDLKRQTR